MVHHEGMFAQERWTPQSLQCGMSPCTQKALPYMSSKSASQQIKKWKLLLLNTPTEYFHFLESHFRWWICRGWQILSSILCSLLYVSILPLRSVLNVKFITSKKSYMWKRMQLKQDIFRFLERETSTKVIWRIKSQEANNKNQVFLKHPRRGRVKKRKIYDSCHVALWQKS